MKKIEKKLVNGLEVFISKPAEACEKKKPLLFVHGAYVGAWTWVDNYLPWFTEQGYCCYAVSLSGHGGSQRRKYIHMQTVDDYVDDVLSVIDWLDEVPVVIGHSLGGFVAQKALERRQAPGLVLMCSAPPQGMMAGQFHLMLNQPSALVDLNQMLESGQPSQNVMRDALFADPPDEMDVNRYLMRMQPESQRAIWDVSIFHHPGLTGSQKPPMLILGGEKDTLVPPFLVQSTAQTYEEHAKIFRGMGHALTHEKDWERVTTAILEWLTKQKL